MHVTPGYVYYNQLACFWILTCYFRSILALGIQLQANMMLQRMLATQHRQA